MEISDELLCLFSATVDEQDGSYTVTIPKHEVTTGDVDSNGVYRVALLEPATTARDDHESDESQTDTDAGPETPVKVGDRRTVEIEGLGEQGDGIARVDRGYVIIVPDTEQRERVTVEITGANSNVAFGEVIERKAYYE